MPKDQQEVGPQIGGDGRGTPISPGRRVLFISHATPQDNVFAAWLATQLAIAGYEVWCDVTKLLGGETFWNDITEAIDTHAFRLLFVSTLEANRKPGTLRELRIALDAERNHKLKDFIVPLKIDEFPFESMQEAVRERNAVRFDANWATGLTQLLKLLEREGAPKSTLAGPDCVTAWYRRTLDATRQHVISNERCISNWFRLRLPKRLLFHKFSGPADTLPGLVSGFPHPHRVHGEYVITFAPRHEVNEQLGTGREFTSSIEVETTTFIEDGDASLEIASRDAFNIATDLVRQAWESAMAGRGLRSHGLASGLPAWFFKNGQLPKNKAYYRALGGRQTYRQLVGRKSKRSIDGGKLPDGFWHYAVSASPQLLPFPRIALRHHVIFTDDGETPWANAQRMHKARRSVCKNWWNPAWRDRLFAFCAQLAQSERDMALAVSADQSIRMTMVPMSFISPWTYFEDGQTCLDETTEIELIEEEQPGEDDDEQS